MGSGGGGLGHDDTQSTHEQAGFTPCGNEGFSELSPSLSSSYIHWFIARNNAWVERRKAIDRPKRRVRSVVDLERNECAAGVTHEAVPP